MMLPVENELAKREIKIAAVATSEGVLAEVLRYGIGDKGKI